MPTKTVTFNRVKFPREVIEQAAVELQKVGTEFMKSEPQVPPEHRLPGHDDTPPAVNYSNMYIRRGDVEWNFDDQHEFLADLAEPYAHARCQVTFSPRHFMSLGVTDHAELGLTSVEATARTRGEVEQIIAPFQKAAPGLRRPAPVQVAPPVPKPVVFLGHGRSPLWRDVKDHLVDLHKYEVQAYETGARSGHTIRDVLSTMLDSSTFAILVMTSEDEQADETMRARQNVVHEAGLFQGRLGFPRVAILREEGVDLFSNIDGIQYIPFSKGNIRETFGDILATLKREFDAER